MENNYLKPKDKKIYEKGYWRKSNEPEILIGGERLGGVLRKIPAVVDGARMFLADFEKAVEKYDKLSRQPGLNPEAIRRIYGGYLEAVDPEDEEKREKARAALERVIEKRITAGAGMAKERMEKRYQREDLY